jgi:hypothetical protein
MLSFSQGEADGQEHPKKNSQDRTQILASVKAIHKIRQEGSAARRAEEAGNAEDVERGRVQT